MKCGSTLGTSFLAQSSSRSRGFLLPLSTTMMVLVGLMLVNVGFLGHLSPGAMGASFFNGL